MFGRIAVYCVIFIAMSGAAFAQDESVEFYPVGRLTADLQSAPVDAIVSLHVTVADPVQVYDALFEQVGIEVRILTDPLTMERPVRSVTMHVEQTPFTDVIKMLLQAANFNCLIEKDMEGKPIRFYIGLEKELSCPIEIAGEIVIANKLLNMKIDSAEIDFSDMSSSINLESGNSNLVYDPGIYEDAFTYNLGGDLAVEMVTGWDRDLWPDESSGLSEELKEEKVAEVREILLQNRDIVDEIAIALMRDGEISGERLSMLLNRVYF